MSFIDRILKPGGKAGWTSVSATGGGVHAVTVAPPAEQGGKPVVMACSTIESETIDAPTLSKLAGKMSGYGFPWTMPLDRKSYNILVIEEPAVRGDEMEQSVRWAISTMVDYPVSEAAISWMKIPTDKLLPNRTPHLYVVVTRIDIVEHYRQVFRQAKLPLRAIDVQETAHRNIASLASNPGEGVALLSVGKRGVQFTVTFGGELYLDRHVEEVVYGSEAGSDAEERARERVVLQVQRSIDFIGRTLPFIDINRLFLAPMPDEPNLRSLIAENMPVPVESLDLSALFDVSRTPQLKREESQASCFVALGSALRFMSGVA